MLKVNHITVSYQRNLNVVEDVSFEVKEGEIVGIIGPNGAGKSTLIKAMMDLIPHQGNAVMDGQPLAKQAQKIAYVQQKSNIDLTFPITVRECVALGLQAHANMFGYTGKNEGKAIAQALEMVDMTDFAKRQIGRLSGGQLQRVLIARCLVQEADLIILDEPFAGIDNRSESAIMIVLRKLRAEGKTILMVHHDLKTVRSYFDSVVMMNIHMIGAGPVATTFTDRNLEQAYGLPMHVNQGGQS
ncbi:metal ABC transporter ATP-binding protein [Lacticaseibacillus zeae]|uniref:Metal ABC transporter ATP-binding protein n=1 Tax=Lacticaseibacillus zeae subsp. silagei TaxID=3068307 RepID=A0ABD7ZCZ6_LACZE|nr:MULTISPECIES: metal ABC transporter ATP-binding protein [Lacticaseibacillus]OFR98935.1 manganese ABC transporter ATP-binding protein [Lactobacillus sp. HMSC068F07]WLV84984.1 metal ABC transporter ATP-binding protein [Lacticaseibacillus sp. NCIMB 15475]WLV87709.1 metal ABC transporter ATP-binding protein [Lacticaseibacillus sp. NCIMB 15474]